MEKKTRPARILIIDDEAPIREVLSASLRDEGHIVMSASDGESGLKAIREFSPELVFLDIWMPGDMDGIEVLTRANKQHPETDFVMISGHGTIETAVKATKLGAWDFIEKPLSMDKILIVISNIIQFQSQREEKQALLNKLRKSIAIIGETPKIVQLKQMIAKVAPMPNWILLQGESGTGKALVASNIHYMSERASKPFVEIDCATLAEDLVEIELMGYEKGAFAGAEKTVRGKLELANGGTVFLDDIEALPLRIQEKILRLAKDKGIKRKGGEELVPLDIRLIAGAPKSLEAEIHAGKFSADLYSYVGSMTFVVPSLRDHSEDIPSLLNHFSDLVAKEGGYLRKEFSEQATKIMCEYSWPGNVIELKNFIERIYILTPGEFVDVHDLRFAGLTGLGSGGDSTGLSTFREARAQFEKEYLLKKIQENNGNISRTAEVIGLERSYLHRKIKAFGIEVQKGNEEI
jgi:two-component system nitrogen regulation response regulator NtrX